MTQHEYMLGLERQLDAEKAAREKAERDEVSQVRHRDGY